jgi:hypothetical protein
LEPSAQPAFTLKHPSLPGSWALGCVSGLFLCFLFIGLSHKKSNQLSHPEGRHATASKLFSPREEEVGATRPRRRRRRGGLRAAGLGEAVVALKPSLGRGGPCRALGRRGSPRKVPRTPTHSPQFTVCNRGGGGRGPGRCQGRKLTEGTRASLDACDPGELPEDSEVPLARPPAARGSLIAAVRGRQLGNALPARRGPRGSCAAGGQWQPGGRRGPAGPGAPPRPLPPHAGGRRAR